MSEPKRAVRDEGVRVWVVASEEHAALVDVVRRMGGGAAALDAGRVFVDGRRAGDPALPLEPGQRVELHPPRRDSGEVELLDRRDGLVAALKPSALPTEPDHHGFDSLRRRVAQMTGVGESRIHAVSRLDVGVSGVVLLACTPAAQRHVEAVRRRGALSRRYVGIVERPPAPPAGLWNAPIGTAHRGRARVVSGGQGLVPAETRYALLGEAGPGLRSVGQGARELAPALVAFEPRTGRTHQIRVHAAHSGSPLLGDRLYGGALAVARSDGRVTEMVRIALHAAWVELPDLRGNAWRVRAPDPLDLVELWADLGGRVDAWGTVHDQHPGPGAGLE